VANGGIGFAYFNITLNSITNWSLSTTAKQSAFKSTMLKTPYSDSPD
jgi:hypothetical protein